MAAIWRKPSSAASRGAPPSICPSIACPATPSFTSWRPYRLSTRPHQTQSRLLLSPPTCYNGGVKPIIGVTSETTPPGDLPWYEQGSSAALMAGDKGTILKMPLTNPEANSTDLTI